MDCRMNGNSSVCSPVEVPELPMRFALAIASRDWTIRAAKLLFMNPMGLFVRLIGLWCWSWVEEEDDPEPIVGEVRVRSKTLLFNVCWRVVMIVEDSLLLDIGFIVLLSSVISFVASFESSLCCREIGGDSSVIVESVAEWTLKAGDCPPCCWPPFIELTNNTIDGNSLNEDLSKVSFSGRCDDSIRGVPLIIVKLSFKSCCEQCFSSSS